MNFSTRKPSPCFREILLEYVVKLSFWPPFASLFDSFISLLLTLSQGSCQIAKQYINNFKNCPKFSTSRNKSYMQEFMSNLLRHSLFIYKLHKRRKMSQTSPRLTDHNAPAQRLAPQASSFLGKITLQRSVNRNKREIILK